jgi:hypothetical protein
VVVFCIPGRQSARSVAIRKFLSHSVKDLTNIEYLPTNDVKTKTFSKYINRDLKVLGLLCLGNLKGRQDRLLSALKACRRFKDAFDGHEAAKYPGAMGQ